jgi:hypothetical protein
MSRARGGWRIYRIKTKVDLQNWTIRGILSNQAKEADLWMLKNTSEM